MLIGYRKEIQKLTFRALVLRRANRGIVRGVWFNYPQKDGATLLVGA